MQKKIFSLLVLLMTAVSGAVAQDTYKIDAVYTINGQPGSQDLSIDDAASLPFTKKLSELDPNSSYWKENNLDVANITVSGDNIVKGTDANWDTEITFNGAGTATVSYGIQYSGYGELGSVTITFTVTKNAPASTTNYYLVGTMNDWGASKQFLLTPNPGNAAEYMITLNLKADTQLKVIGVEEGKETVWYPSGDNYVVNDAGQYTVYFRPDGQGGEGWHYGCIYLDPAPAPAVPLTDLGSGQWQFQMPGYAVVAKIEYDTELELQEENVNTAVLADWDGYEADITLKRKLIAGSWNTLAVPFNVSNTMLGYLTSTYGMQVKQLASVDVDGEHITLNFTDATEMVAGTPYLVKVSTDYDFSARALPNVEVNKEFHPVTSTYIDFIPTLGKTTIGSEGDDPTNVLFVASGNKLKNPEKMPAYMKGFRAYFLLKDASTARSFVLNIDGESTGIESLTTSPMAEGSTYDLQGRKVNAAQKGVYIVNGKKVIK